MTEHSEARCVTCGGRGGWWSMIDRPTPAKNGGIETRRETCSACNGTGWEQRPSIAGVVASMVDEDGFTPKETGK